MRQKRRKSKTPPFLLALVVLIIALTLSCAGQADTDKAEVDLPKAKYADELTFVGPVRDVKPVQLMQIPEPLEEIEPEAVPEPVLDEAEVEMLACVIYQEAGGDACSDLARKYVGDVVLNRVADPRFPDTLEGVLLQEGQYGRFCWTGIVWPDRAQYEVEAAAVARAYDTARSLLAGEHSEIYGEGYIWQAEFSQGTDVIFLDGIYFGR